MRAILSRIDAQLLDAGKRASDIINTYRVHRPWDELSRKWIAISLADGSSDGTLYDTRADAVRHQRDERRCVYIAFRSLTGGANPRDMAEVILYNRDAYEAGFRLIDPDAKDGGQDLAYTSAQHDMRRLPILDAFARRRAGIIPR